MLRAREVAAYDAPLIEYGRVLLRLRAELTEMLAPLAAQAYQRISTGREKFALRFLPGASDDFGAISGTPIANQSVYVRQLSVHIATIWNCSSTIYRRRNSPRKGSSGQLCWQ